MIKGRGKDDALRCARYLDTSIGLIPSAPLSAVSLARSHIEGKPEFQTVIARAHEAVAEAIDTWAQRPRLRGRPLIDLDAEKVEEERESHERLTVEDLRASLAQGRRIILEAPAGRGKTTTLVQIAQRTIAEGGLAFLVDLPFWVRTGMEILQFVAQAPAFARRGLDAKALLKLRGTEPFLFC